MLIKLTWWKCLMHASHCKLVYNVISNNNTHTYIRKFSILYARKILDICTHTIYTFVCERMCVDVNFCPSAHLLWHLPRPHSICCACTPMSLFSSCRPFLAEGVEVSIRTNRNKQSWCVVEGSWCWSREEIRQKWLRISVVADRKKHLRIGEGKGWQERWENPFR